MDIEVPGLSHLIQTAEASGTEDTAQDQEIIKSLSEKYKQDRDASLKGGEITYSSIQYISELIQNNETYKNFLLSQAQALVKKLLRTP